MFYKHSREGKVTILIVYIDDIVLTGDDSVELVSKISFSEWSLLGRKRVVFVIQRKYTLDLLSEIALPGCKDIKTPIEPNLKLQHAIELKM